MWNLTWLCADIVVKTKMLGFKWGIVPLSIYLVLFNMVQCVSAHPRRVLSELLCGSLSEADLLA